MKYEYVRIKSNKIVGSRFGEHRKIFDDHAARGWRYAGYIPVITNDYGKYNKDRSDL